MRNLLVDVQIKTKMEINFQPSSPTMQHFISAMEKDSLLLLNERSIKTSLIFLILREYIRMNNKSGVLVKPSSKEHSNEFESLMKCLTNTTLNEIKSNENQTLFDSEGEVMVLTALMEKVPNLLKEDEFSKNVCLLLIDLTELEELDLKTLHAANVICHACKSHGIRIVIVCCIERYLNDLQRLQDMFDNKFSALPLRQSIANDSLLFCNDGNILEISTNFCDENPLCDDVISKYLKSICEFLLHVNIENQFSEDPKHCIDMWNDIETVYINYGLLAFCHSLLIAEEFIERWKFGSRNDELLIVRYMESQIQLLDRFAKSSSDAKHARKCPMISPCFAKLIDLIKKLFQVSDSCSFNTNQFVTEPQGTLLKYTSLYIIAESNFVTKCLYGLLENLQKTQSWLFPPDIEITLSEISKPSNKCFQFIVRKALSNFHSRPVGSSNNGLCVFFKIPSDYQEFLRSTELFNGRIKEVMYVISSRDTESRKRIKNIQEIQEQLSRRIPSCINPCLAQKVFHRYCNKLSSFSIPGSDFVVTPEKSVRIVNKYCQFLSAGYSASSQSSVWHSTEMKINRQNGTIAAQTTLSFPARSLLKKSIKGPWITCETSEPDYDVCVTILSRMAACVEACKMLYRAGELDENMFPSRKRRATGLPDSSECNDDVVALSQKKLYHKKIPERLLNSFPKAETNVFLYVVKAKYLDVSKTPAIDKCLGFCTMKQLPQTPSFVVYNRSSKIILIVSEVSDSTTLDSHSIHTLSRFSSYAITHVLQYPLSNCHEHEDSNGLLWTVLREKDDTYAIDYEFLESAEFPGNGYALDKLKMLEFDVFESLFDSVVIPVHRGNANDFCYVDPHCTHVKVDNAFPNAEVATNYIEYFKNKYNIELTSGRSMLKVFPANKNLNFLKPRREEEKNASLNSKQKQSTYLPAELCAVHPIPRNLWEQILHIPVLLYRMSCVLLVNELQLELCEKLGVIEASSEVGLAECMSGPILRTETPGNSLPSAVFQSTRRRDDGGCDIALALSDLSQEDMNKRSTHSCNSRFADKAPNLSETDSSTVDSMNRLSVNIGSLESMQSMVHRKFSSDTHKEGIDNAKDNHNLADALDKLKLDSEDAWCMDVMKHRKSLQALHWDDQYKFPSLYLLLRAFTTANANDIFHHERLEFLGDAFLNAFVVTELFLHYQQESEHVLCQMKSIDVSNKRLFEKGQRLGLWRYVIDEQFDFKSNPMVLSILGCMKCDVCNDETVKEDNRSSAIKSKCFDSEGFPIGIDLNNPSNVKCRCDKGNKELLHICDYRRDKRDNCSSVSKTKYFGRDEIPSDGDLKPSNDYHYGFVKGDEELCKKCMERCFCCDREDKRANCSSVTNTGFSNREEIPSDLNASNNINDKCDKDNKELLAERKNCNFPNDRGDKHDNCSSVAITEYSDRKKSPSDSDLNALKDDNHGFKYTEVSNERSDMGDEVDNVLTKSEGRKAVEAPKENALFGSAGKYNNFNNAVSNTEDPVDTSCLQTAGEGYSSYGCDPGIPTLNINSAHPSSSFKTSIRKKAIADSVEALIGLFYLNNGEETALKVMKLVGFDVCCIPREGVEQTKPDIAASDVYSDSKKPISSFVLKELAIFETRIGYEFKDKKLLYEAFLHKTYPRKLACETYCNQRQEFLGDALLTLLVTRYLCRVYPKANNAELTIMRSVIVNSRTYATVAVVNNFHRYLMFLSSDLANEIQVFDEEISSFAANGNLWPSICAEDLCSYHSKENSMLPGIKVPKDLDDVFESVAAAIYLDSHNIEYVWNCYHPMLKDVLESLPSPRTLSSDC